jgi:hypothetical protein
MPFGITFVEGLVNQKVGPPLSPSPTIGSGRTQLVARRGIFPPEIVAYLLGRQRIKIGRWKQRSLNARSDELGRHASVTNLF